MHINITSVPVSCKDCLMLRPRRVSHNKESARIINANNVSSKTKASALPCSSDLHWLLWSVLTQTANFKATRVRPTTHPLHQTSVVAFVHSFFNLSSFASFSDPDDARAGIPAQRPKHGASQCADARRRRGVLQHGGANQLSARGPRVPGSPAKSQHTNRIHPI